MVETHLNSRNDDPARWVRWLFWTAGIYGVVVLLPDYFLRNRMDHDYPPAITHSEYFYGFIGVGLAWQVAFLIIATDPRRFRPLMIPGVLEKFSFAGAIAILFASNQVPTALGYFALVDFVLGSLFLLAFRTVGKRASNSDTARIK
jgi:hypothetical protein